MVKRAGNYHFQLLLQNSSRKNLQIMLDQLVPLLYNAKEGNKVRWSLDVDPVDLY
jgi:primosomal protein N' (replication factor Y)